MFQDGMDLVQRYAREPLYELGDLCAVLEIFEQGRDWYSSAAKHPRAAHALTVAFDYRAGGPVDHD